MAGRGKARSATSLKDALTQEIVGPRRGTGGPPRVNPLPDAAPSPAPPQAASSRRDTCDDSIPDNAEQLAGAGDSSQDDAADDSNLGEVIPSTLWGACQSKACGS